MIQTKRKMRVGVLGAGAVAKDLHLPVLVNLHEVKLKWICDKDQKRAEKLAKLFRIPAVYTDITLCSDVDIVLVAIPVGYRFPIMQSIMTRGWNAFCEKPFAVTLDEYEQYIGEGIKNNVKLGIGLVRRYGSPTIMAKKIVRERIFGPISEVWAMEGTRTKRTGQESGWYMTDPKASGGGSLMETGSHLVDQLCTILGVTGFRVDKCTQRVFSNLEFETKFIGSVSNEDQQDISCVFEISCLEDLCNGIFIRFPNFIIKCGLFFEDSLELLTLNGDPIVRFEIEEGAKTIGQAFYLEWQDFIAQCTTGLPSIVSADTARQSIAIIDECYRNSEKINVNGEM